MRIGKLLSIPSLLLLGSGAALADDAGGYAPELVVVTATRTPQPAELTGTSISVITAGQLKTEQTLVLTDALKETPGLNVTRTGGVGENTEVTIRGSEPGQVLVLVDGIRINDPTAPDGAAVLSDVLVNDIARVEILRGPQSTLYGSQAIGGVINVITESGGDGLALRGSSEGGALETYRINAAGNGTEGPVEFGGAVNYLATTGISAADSRNGNTEPDGYRNLGATLNTRIHLDDDLSLDLRGYYTQSHTDIDGYPPPNFTLQDDPEFGADSLLAGYAGVNWSLFGGKFTNRFAVSESDADRKYFGVFDPVTFAFSPLENFYARGTALRLEYQGVVQMAPQSQLTFGAEDERTGMDTASPDQFDPNPPPLLAHVRIDSFYAQVQTTVADGLTLTAGARDDAHQTFGNHASAKLAAAWQLAGGNTILRANYGNGFKAPTLYELFSPYSNPVRSLAPETSTGWEAGVDQYLWDKRVRLSATYFRRNTGNQIAFVSCFGVVSAACATRPFGYYDNVDHAQASGVELEAAARVSDALSLTANYSHIDAVDLSDHAPLPRVPHDLAFGEVTWTPDDAWSLTGSVSYTGDSYDSAGRFGHLGAYTLANFYVSYQLCEQFQLYGRVENVFDTHYEQTLGFGALGRTASAGIRASL
jgi:vitamin B12 transporter